MLEGINVLNQTEMTKLMATSVLGKNLIIIFGVIAVLNLILCLIFANDHSNKSLIFMIIMVASAVLLIISISIFLKDVPLGKYRYEVTIGDDVNLNEFMKQYEIIQRRGEIYTIKEREKEQE